MPKRKAKVSKKSLRLKYIAVVVIAFVALLSVYAFAQNNYYESQPENISGKAYNFCQKFVRSVCAVGDYGFWKSCVGYVTARYC